MSIFTNRSASSKEEAQEYTAALLGLVGEREPLAVLPATEGTLRGIIAGIPADRLSEPEAPGKWSVRQVLAHFADSELVFGWRLRMALAHDRPDIQGYDQDLWAEHLRYDEAEAEQSLDTFGVLRRWNLRLLIAATPEQRKRYGVHSERGQESVEHMMKLYSGHDTLHINQINRILGVTSV